MNPIYEDKKLEKNFKSGYLYIHRRKVKILTLKLEYMH